jgi:hypothetical protein
VCYTPSSEPYRIYKKKVVLKDKITEEINEKFNYINNADENK